ncbi:MAG: amidohydrolase [Bacteroidetes bacterium HGW-Bacteroidetes-17]|jgi:aminobenzoyl-glutamate utilization protein B|nr:MAG: amidohydrolase [Bacteroidetes bacterium HGW-Bacteroidetes-17]
MKKLFVLSLALLLNVEMFSQKNNSKQNEYVEKTFALNYLSNERTIMKFGKISDAIWSYAELGMQEFKSSALLASTLEAEGFTVDRGVAGMPTAFVASYGSGKPVIAILGEFDALPMISQKGRVSKQEPLINGAPGHGCGHNEMCTAAAAAAIAVKEAMIKFGLKGTIRVYGSPAEETIISRPYMIKAGLFDDVDMVIDNHSSSDFSTGYGVSGNAIISTFFTFKGKTAHSSGAPWSGRSALDAVEIMNVSTNYLREHLFYTERMHYVITAGGEAPNVVPDKATVWYYVRNSDDKVEEMFERVLNCAKGAALATGTELVEVRTIAAAHQRHSNKGMAELLQRNIEIVGMPAWTDDEKEFAKAVQKELGKEEKGMPIKIEGLEAPKETFVGGGSSDVGDVTLVAPTATLRFPGGIPGGISHHWSNVTANYGSTAWKGLNAGAKVMAASAIDLFMNEDLRNIIIQEFKDYSVKHPYKSFLPEDAKPPVDLNKELMEKWTIELSKFYLEEK